MTLVILTGGIVFIYRSFFLCVDYLSRLTMRLHAHELIDAKIADIARSVQTFGDLSFDRGSHITTQTINHKQVDFYYQVQVDQISGFDNLYQLHVGVSWMDGPRRTNHTRLSLLEL